MVMAAFRAHYVLMVLFAFVGMMEKELSCGFLYAIYFQPLMDIICVVQISSTYCSGAREEAASLSVWKLSSIKHG
jgi:hypothetical protein